MKKHTEIPFKPWEIMSYAKDLFGLGYMQRLLGIKSHTQVYRYCRNPEIITEYFQKHGKDSERRAG